MACHTAKEGKNFAALLSFANIFYFAFALLTHKNFSIISLHHLHSATRKMALLVLLVSVLILIIGWLRKVFNAKFIVLATLLPLNSFLLMTGLRIDVLVVHWIIQIMLVATLITLSSNRKKSATAAIQVFMKTAFVLIFELIGATLYIYSTGSASLIDPMIIDSQLFTLSMILIALPWLTWALIFPFNSWFIDLTETIEFEALAFILMAVCFPSFIKIIDLYIGLSPHVPAANFSVITIGIWVICTVSAIYNFLLASKVQRTGSFIGFLVSGIFSICAFALTINPIFYIENRVFHYVLATVLPGISLFILFSPYFDQVGTVRQISGKKLGQILPKYYLFSVIFYFLLIFGLPLGRLFWDRIYILERLFYSAGTLPIVFSLSVMIFAVYPLFRLVNYTSEENTQLPNGISWVTTSLTGELFRVIFLLVVLTLSIFPAIITTYL
mgnify:CR=1 FL=1